MRLNAVEADNNDNSYCDNPSIMKKLVAAECVIQSYTHEEGSYCSVAQIDIGLIIIGDILKGALLNLAV